VGEFLAIVFLKRRAICRAAIVSAFGAFVLFLIVINVVVLLQLPPWMMQASLPLLAEIFVPMFFLAAWMGGPQTHGELLEWYRFQAERGDTYARDYLNEDARCTK
jgi:hypothetical protein